MRNLLLLALLAFSIPCLADDGQTDAPDARFQAVLSVEYSHTAGFETLVTTIYCPAVLYDDEGRLAVARECLELLQSFANGTPKLTPKDGGQVQPAAQQTGENHAGQRPQAAPNAKLFFRASDNVIFIPSEKVLAGAQDKRAFTLINAYADILKNPRHMADTQQKQAIEDTFAQWGNKSLSPEKAEELLKQNKPPYTHTFTFDNWED